MKKLLVAVLVGALTLSTVACGGAAEQATGTENSTATTEQTEFVVGFDAAFPPYGYLDEATGEYVGFDLSLAEEVCKRNEWILVKTPIDWDAKDMELNSGAIDCIWNGFTMNGREDQYAWSDPYVDNTQVFVVKADSGITSIADLENKVVLVQADSSALTALEGEDLAAVTSSFAELQQVPEYNTAFLNIEAGAADAVAMDIGVADYQLESRGDGFVILEEAISSEQYGIGFAKDNTELRDQVQKTLNEMVSDGTFAKIAEDWGLSDMVCLGK